MLSSAGLRSGYCSLENDMRLPTYDEIKRDERQLAVYEAPFDESLFVAGPPGSGKTVLVIRRAQMLLAKPDHSVMIITYNRMLRRLIAQLTAGEQRVQAQTMHSFVYGHYREKANVTKVPEIKQYKLDWNVMFETLQRHGIHPHLTHVIIDEGQDLPTEFFRYLRNFVATTVMVAADEEQALRSERSTIRDIKEAAHLDDPFLFEYNHRNSPEIARVVEHFHTGDLPVPAVVRPKSGEIPCILLYSENGAMRRIANWYQTRGGRIAVAVIQNGTGEILYSQLQENLSGDSIQIYTSSRRNENDIELLKDGITILNVESIKGQEFDTVFIMEFDKLLLETNEMNQRKMYMLCARARDHLFLMHEGNHLPPELLRQLPGDDILKRP
ncbi:MAG: AAA family ATPase [Synechococcus sp. SB0663_bin_10]|nr:AAA family ATPase [Synechococcus sp. SB0663_bin_10]